MRVKLLSPSPDDPRRYAKVIAELRDLRGPPMRSPDWFVRFRKSRAHRARGKRSDYSPGPAPGPSAELCGRPHGTNGLRPAGPTREWR
jgi:hypothetical protein